VRYIFSIFAVSLALTAGATSGLAEGSAAQGEDLFNTRCKSCHTVDEGDRDKVGPNLFGLFGARAGQRAFSYEQRHSKALKQSGVVWSEETLDQYLENPKVFIPKNRMPFPGLKKVSDREDIIAYLKSVTQ